MTMTSATRSRRVAPHYEEMVLHRTIALAWHSSVSADASRPSEPDISRALQEAGWRSMGDSMATVSREADTRLMARFPRPRFTGEDLRRSRETIARLAAERMAAEQDPDF